MYISAGRNGKRKNTVVNNVQSEKWGSQLVTGSKLFKMEHMKEAPKICLLLLIEADFYSSFK